MWNQFRYGIGSLCTCCLSVLTLISASSPQAAIHLLSHKIQSPQEKEALQALTVCNGDPYLLIFKFFCFNWVNLLVWGNNCPLPSNEPPLHVSLYSLLMCTNIHSKHVFACHVSCKGHRWLPKVQNQRDSLELVSCHQGSFWWLR